MSAQAKTHVVCRSTGKIRHETEAEANEAAKRWTKRFGVPMRAYHCKPDGCFGWHNTKVKAGER